MDPSDAEAYTAQLSQLHDRWALSLLELCRTNGGIYVKAGQMAAAFGAVSAPPQVPMLHILSSNTAYFAHPIGNENEPFIKACFQLQVSSIAAVGPLPFFRHPPPHAQEFTSLRYMPPPQVPIEFRRQLQLLEDRARPRPTNQIERVLFEEFGGFSSAVFAEFEPQATAAASLAQVHNLISNFCIFM